MHGTLQAVVILFSEVKYLLLNTTLFLPFHTIRTCFQISYIFEKTCCKYIVATYALIEALCRSSAMINQILALETGSFEAL